MQSNNLIHFLGKIFGSCKISGKDEVLFFCCYCRHHNKKLSINLTNHIFHCWVCNKSGTIVALLKDQKASSSKIAEYIATFKPKPKIYKSSTRYVQVYIGENYYSPTLPQEYQPLIMSKGSIMSKKAFEYLQKRNITEDQILQCKLGFCSTGDYANRIIIPSFDRDGNLNFFTTRDITEQSEIPYLNDKKMPKGYKNSIIINELNLDLQKEVVVVEGFFDMFKSTPNTIPLCGSSLTKDNLLFQTLAQHQCNVVLALDPDAFFKKTLQVAELMLSYGMQVKIADFRPYKDLGAMTPEEAALRIKNAKIVDEFFLRRMKLKGLFNND